MTKSGGQFPAPNSVGDLSSPWGGLVAPGVYAHVSNKEIFDGELSAVTRKVHF